MINNIEIDGFRSLSNFKLELRPGLNILVGPNGSGKTNIITFFEFLSHLVIDGPSEAVNKFGGAGSVFTINKDEHDFEHQIKVSISGCAEIKKDRFVQYLYNFIIEGSESFDSISFKEQELTINISKTFLTEENYLSLALSIKQKSIDCKSYTYEISNFKKVMFDSSFLPPAIRKDFSGNKKMIEEFLKNNIKEDNSLVSGLSFLLDSTNYIVNDLRGGQVFNIIPSRIKTPEESSGSPGIKKDGSGLAATLYAIKNKKHQVDLHFPGKLIIRRFQSVNLRETTLEDIQKYLVTANPAIKRLDVINDRFDNLLKVRFWIEKKDRTTILPLSAMSDGTIKWLALVTAILTSPTIFSLEEPENFLHPLMQSEVVKLMRYSASEKSSNTTIIMSTHSETILNSADPNEIVIVSFQDGSTKAHRCSNSSEIAEEIKRTGLGLGYYYISGSLLNG